MGFQRGGDFMSRKRRVPDWIYYAVAVVISLLTIPMYRYLFAHANDVRPVAVYVDRGDSSSVVAAPLPVRKPLLPGELCEAGYVVLKNGSSYTQGLDSAGRPSLCVDGYLIESP
jgi:hypothetical protein